MKDEPDRLIDGYRRLRGEATAGGEGHYPEVRRSFNRDRCPVEFFFLLRTCRFGHVRINAKGDFTRPSIVAGPVHPDRLWPVVDAWHRKLVTADVRFAVRDYGKIVSRPGDLLYLDPPYPTSTLYYGRMDYGELFSWLGASRAATSSRSTGLSVARIAPSPCPATCTTSMCRSRRATCGSIA